MHIRPILQPVFQRCKLVKRTESQLRSPVNDDIAAFPQVARNGAFASAAVAQHILRDDCPSRLTQARCHG